MAGLSQLLGRKKAPAMTGSFTPQEKTSPSAKTQRCEVGAWQPAAVREEPLGQSVFLRRQCGKASQPARACLIQHPSCHGASGRASGEQCGAGKDSETPGGGRKLRGLFAAQRTA